MFRMGCATVDVTPDFPVFLRGYGARNELSSGVADPIAAGVVALELKVFGFLYKFINLWTHNYMN